MIKRIIVVEDGTVDLDDLQETLGDDTKIIVYRQGSNPPNILELQEPARYAYENERESNRLEKEVSSLNTRLKSLLDEGKITMDIIESQYQSWKGDKGKGKPGKRITFNSYHTLQRMDQLYNELFINKTNQGGTINE